MDMKTENLSPQIANRATILNNYNTEERKKQLKDVSSILSWLLERTLSREDTAKEDTGGENTVIGDQSRTVLGNSQYKKWEQ